MFEDILEFLEPVLNVFTAVVILSLGIALCLGCLMLTFKVCGHFKAYIKEKAVRSLNKWHRRADNVVARIGERIGHFVSEAVEQSKPDTPVDLRPRMAGEWVSTNGDYMTISAHNGYYRVTFRGDDIPKSVLEQDFILRDIQGWLHDNNVYCAESLDLLTLAVSTDVDEIFVSELKRTYHRNKPDIFTIGDMEGSLILSEAVRERILESAYSPSDKSVDHFNTNIFE